jgi:hypothetical protein
MVVCVGEWLLVGVAVWVVWYVQGFVLGFESQPHRHPHTQEIIRSYEL